MKDSRSTNSNVITIMNISFHLLPTLQRSYPDFLFGGSSNVGVGILLVTFAHFGIKKHKEDFYVADDVH